MRRSDYTDCKKSTDSHRFSQITTCRLSLKILCRKIESVWQFGFFFLLFFTFLLPVSLHAQTKSSFFWDAVENLSEKNSYFPTALYDSHNSYVFFEVADKARKEIKVSWRQKKDALDWSDTFSLSDTFRYSGEDVPDMYSTAISSEGKIAVSVLDSSSSASVVKVYVSSDNASSFSSFGFPAQQKQITSSRIFSTGTGFILFISLGEGKQNPTESSFSLLYSESIDGEKWTDLAAFKPAEHISNAFSPFFVKIGGKDFVFFEGWSGRDSTTSLVYASSRTGIASLWSEPSVLTDSLSMLDSSSYLDVKNFRPFVLSNGVDTKIVWERTSKTGNTATVMVASLNSEGKITDKNDVEELNSFGNGRRPELFLFNGRFFAMWFDDRNDR